MADLGPDRLTRDLRRSLGTDASVTAVSEASIGTGQVGENVRLELTWNRVDGALPASVVAKLPSTNEVSRSTAVQIDTYRKEIGFYRDLQHQVGIRTPGLHALDWDPDTHDFVLLMEDIAPATQGDQLTGCDLAAAELAVDQAVALHAPTWGRASEYDFDWLEQPGADPDAAGRSQLLGLLAPGFLDRYRDRLDATTLDLTGALSEAYVRWQQLVRGWASTNGWCVVHGDYRLDNMLFGRPPESPALTVVDWQTPAVGIGPSDIAYFCGAGLLPDDRRRHERALVERYAAGLRDAGVELSDDAAWDGYVLGGPNGYLMAVLASQIVERTERGDEMFAVMAERHADQVRSCGLLDLLGS